VRTKAPRTAVIMVAIALVAGAVALEWFHRRDLIAE
jgi:hypothetical protein